MIEFSAVGTVVRRGIEGALLSLLLAIVLAGLSLIFAPGDAAAAPTGSADATCQTISGSATDPLAPGTQLSIVIMYSAGGPDGGPFAAGGTTNPSTGQFSIPVPQSVRQNTGIITVRIFAHDAGGQQVELGGSPRTIGPCYVITAECGGMVLTPAKIDPNTPFQVTVSVRFGNAAEAAAVAAQPDVRYRLSVNGPNLAYNQGDVRPIRVEGEQLLITVGFNPTRASGRYFVRYSVNSSLGGRECGGNQLSFIVGNNPYVSVRNGDVSAGSGMSIRGMDCALPPNTFGSVVGWNRGPAGDYGGAGSQYATFAFNFIQDFATAQGSAGAPTRLSFANNAAGQVNVNGGLYGGKFGATSCVKDYLEGASNIQTGNITVNGQVVGNGEHRVIYIRGNAYITGNIVFTGTYANDTRIPSFALVVEGNIYVAPNVTQLDGIYVAQPSGVGQNDGIFYSCAPSPFAAAALDRSLQPACSAPLTVNGSVTGRQVWLLRTAGTVTAGPAETFNYSPEIWAAPRRGAGLGEVRDYDAITSLPPVL